MPAEPRRKHPSDDEIDIRRARGEVRLFCLPTSPLFLFSLLRSRVQNVEGMPHPLCFFRSRAEA